MKKQSILDLSKEELSEVIKPSFRAKQIYQWLYQKYVISFEEMKNLPKELKAQLEENYYLDPLAIVKIEESKDGSKKYLFALKDGNTVESVLLPPSPDSNFSIHTDERDESEMIKGVGSMKQRLVIGDRYGIPDWLAMKMNNILLLNNFLK